MKYDAWGNPTVVTDTRGFTTTTVYDSQYHLYPVQMSNALGQSTQTQYNYGLGLPSTITDANGHGATNKFDDASRQLTRRLQAADRVAKALGVTPIALLEAA